MVSVKLMRMSIFSVKRFKTPLFPNVDRRWSRKLYVTLCRSRDGDSSSDGYKPQGDARKQELLARIAMLQAQKLRLTDYLDERSAYLTQFAEEANAEIDAIGQNALKDLDQAAARIMDNIESKMQAFEDSLEQDKQATQEREKELQDFQGEIEKGRNEGMFFKSFRQRKPIDKAKAKEEAEQISKLTLQIAASKARRNIYIALIALLTIGIADSLLNYPQNWQKITLLALIFTALLSQFIYEQKLLHQINKDEQDSE